MDWVALLEKLKLWQFTLLLSVFLGALGFTGKGLLGAENVLEGKENMAIFGFFSLLSVSILLRYLPPPERRGGDRPQMAISPTQTALCSQITEWTPFEEAAEINTLDNKLQLAELKRKNTELRLELATLQGLLVRQVDGNGKHLVKYRWASDDTTFIGG